DLATTGGLSAQVTVSVAQAAAQLIKAGGDGQTGVVRATLPSALALEVVDAGNRPMAGVTVTFAVTLGGGSLSNPSGPTDGSGLTTIHWTLGTTPGQLQLVQASLAGTSVSPATFSATATAGPPASVTKLGGDGQTAATNNPVSTPPSVQVSDSYGDHVPGVTVTFAATAGSGTVQLGVNTLTATASGSGITGNPVTLAATGASAAYHIDVRYLTAVTPAQRQAFDGAAAQWERLIYGDVSDEFASFPAGTCGPGTPVINEIIDDIIIY